MIKSGYMAGQITAVFSIKLPILPLIILAALAISYIISIKIYRKKEF